jgi:hypothetical protein
MCLKQIQQAPLATEISSKQRDSGVKETTGQLNNEVSGITELENHKAILVSSY